MSILEYIKDLLNQGVELVLVDNKLKLKAAKGILDASQLAELKTRKTAIIALFQQLNLSSSKSFEYLSYSQQRLWLIEKINPVAGQYNMPAQVEINGALDVPLLKQCLNQLLTRHQILRTRYVETDDGTPVQVVGDGFELPLSRWDLSDSSEQKQEQEQAQALAQICAEQAVKGFDLSADLMLRAGLVTLSHSRSASRSASHSASNYVLLLNMHHIASDGWSKSIIVAELAQMYANGNQSLPPLQLQYADYAHWQKQWFASEQLQSQTDFWQQQLRNMPWVHNLPLDRPRQATQDPRAGEHYQLISAKTLAGLNQLAGSQQVTLFMLLHCAYSVLIHRYCGDTDIVIGTPVANRENQDLAELVEFFANTLVLRLDLSDQPDFASLLQQSKQYLLAAFEHQQMPFEKLVEVLQPPRNMSHNPLVQLMLSFQSKQDVAAMDISRFEDQTLEMKPIPVHSQVAKFDLLLNAQETEQGLALNWEYASGLFDHRTIVALSQHLTAILEAVVDSSNQAVAAIPLLNAQQQQTMVQQWNESSLIHPHQQCIHELFIAQVVLQPDAIALIDDQGEMSYLALFEQALSLADQLLVLEVKPQQLVAVRLAKGRLQVVATLAIMMAGGAYLPLECDWPQQRCRDILSRSQTVILIAAGDDAIEGVITIYPASDSHSPRDSLLTRASQFTSRQRYDDLAYVIFTSGSTGVPKGVAIEHASAVNTLLDINAQYGVTQHDRVLAVSALSFDLSVYDFFGFLAAGATTVLPSHQQTKNPQHWLEMVEKYQITLWNTVPTSAGLLVEQLEFADRISTAPLRVVVMSGDWIDPKLPARLWHKFPGVRLYSLGGATEGAIWSIHYPINADTSHLRSVPYGKPLNGQAFYILNPQLQHCPVGVTGELFIGGLGVARGYYGQADLTARQFIHHPVLQQRLYRTGDTGRYRADGNIEFMGRVDNQLKIRGFRIEPGEIEAQLVKHPAISKVLVLAKKDPAGATYLVAYFTYQQQQQQQALSASELRQFIIGSVPIYMMPNAFVGLAQWPLTANGKVDLKALPEVDLAAQQVAFEAPTTEVEIALCAMVEQLLELESVGLADNFFALGGHSLLALRLNVLIRRAFALELATTDFFTASTMADLAAKIEANKTAATAIHIGVKPESAAPMLSFAQQRLWLLDSIEQGSTHYNMAATLPLTGQLDVAALQQAFATILQRHQSLRTCFLADDDGMPYQRIIPLEQLNPTAISVVDLSSLSANKQQQCLAELAQNERNTPFDLAADVMLRGQLVRLNSDHHVLLVTLHHIASDGWSMGIVIREFSTLYRAYVEGLADPLTPLSIQYADYAYWQRQWLQGEVLASQLDYWQHQFSSSRSR
jgi:amino acid adenylation domain-containing protein